MSDRSHRETGRRSVRVPLAVLSLLLLAAASATAAPKAKVEPAVIDLGTIQEGNQFERYIMLTNEGDGTLVLEDVKTSCGCTAAAVDAGVELGPGDTQQIRITFDSRRMDGDISKKITVTTNDPENRSQVVTLNAVVHKPVRFEPKYVRLNGVGPGDDWQQVVRLEADPELGLEVTDAFILGGQQRKDGRIVPAPTEMFDLEVGDRQSVDGRDVWEMTVRLREDARPQKLSETLVVTTNSAERDSLKLSIRGEVTGRISVAPSFAVLKMVDPGETAERDVVLAAREGAFRVLSAEVADSPLGVDVLPQPDGKTVVVRLTYTGEEAGMSGVRQLRVRTDDPEQDLIEVPVRYQTRGAPPPGSTPNYGPRDPAQTPTSGGPGVGKK